MRQTFLQMFSIAVCLVLQTACTSTPSLAPTLIPPLSLSKVPFTSEESGYSLQYPQGWATEEGDEPGVIIFLDNRIKPGSGGLPAVPVSVTVLAGSRTSLGLPRGELTSPPVLNPLMQKLRIGTNFEPHTLGTGWVAGNPSAKLEVKGQLESGIALVGEVVVVDLGDRLWTIFALAPAGEWDGFKLFFQQMVDSVRFTKK